MKQKTKQEMFKEVMSNYPTGVTIVTTVDNNGKPVGLTVNSFTSVSLNPLLVLWCIDNNSSSYNAFVEGKNFAVNILAEDQRDLCKIFASKNEDRFKSCDWKLSDNHLPIISGTTAVLECHKKEVIHAGDHAILIGEVVNIRLSDKNAMLYHKRHFGPIPSDFYLTV